MEKKHNDFFYPNGLRSLSVNLPEILPRSYPIWINSHLLQQIDIWLPKQAESFVIITDDTVKSYYASHVHTALKKAGYDSHLVSCPAGESSKNYQTKACLEEQLLQKNIGRNSILLAIGGGVIGDLAGFIAATYCRGIPYVQIPTTLLAMVDSSVGGKTGINTPQGKNLIGAFWQPSAVVADVACLQTLSQKHMINGLIEAFKLFLTCDKDGVHYLENHLNLILGYDTEALIELIYRSVSLKARVVALDEKENHQRAILNLGHTIGHALESITNYQLLHGYAVALGLLVEAKIAEHLGLLSTGDYQQIKTFVMRLGIHSNELLSFDIDAILAATQTDKKRQHNETHYVLLCGLGRVYEDKQRFAHPVSNDIVRQAFFATIGE